MSYSNMQSDLTLVVGRRRYRRKLTENWENTQTSTITSQTYAIKVQISTITDEIYSYEKLLKTTKIKRKGKKSKNWEKKPENRGNDKVMTYVCWVVGDSPEKTTGKASNSGQHFQKSTKWKNETDRKIDRVMCYSNMQSDLRLVAGRRRYRRKGDRKKRERKEEERVEREREERRKWKKNKKIEYLY